MATPGQINEAAARSSSWIKARQKKHTKMIIGAIENLQNDILRLGRELEISPDGIIAGPTQNWQKAQSIHQSIIKDFGDTFDKTAKKITDDFAKANADVKANFNTVGEIVKYTGVNREMFSSLRDGYYQDYLAISAAAQQKINKAFYNHVLGSSSFDSLESSIRSVLIGSNAKSATGRPLSVYSKLYARDMIANYHNDVTQTKARDLGMEYFKYIGTIMSRSRRFCRLRVGKTFSKKEIMSWNYKWAGRSGPALTNRGGYNCRHHWQPVRKDWLSERDQAEVDSLNRLDKDGNIIKTGKTGKPAGIPTITPKVIPQAENTLKFKTGRTTAKTTPTPKVIPQAPQIIPLDMKDTATLSFTKSVDDILNGMPPKVKQALNANGVVVKGGHHLTETYEGLKGVTPRGWAANTTWDAAEGLYRMDTKEVGIFEYVKYSNDSDWVKGRSPEDILPHEIGHAFDKSNPTEIPYSTTPEFKKAYQADLKRIADEDIDTQYYAYFLQQGVAGRSETFAEGFSQINGGSLRDRFADVFPNSLQYISEILEAL